jgi:hypothetical protein
MAMGGVGVSLAGFAGLVAALTPQSAQPSPITKWRITHIVVWSFQTAFIGFGVVAVYALVHNVSTTARIVSGVAALVMASRGFNSTRPGPVWPIERERTQVRWMAAAVTVILVGNVALGNVGFLHVIMLLLLLSPASVFQAAVREFYDERYRGTTADVAFPHEEAP